MLINCELAALKLMLRLEERAGKVVNRPRIGMLKENNTRKGFFEADQGEAVLRHLPADLRPVFEVGYITGWRVKDEILTWQPPKSAIISAQSCPATQSKRSSTRALPHWMSRCPGELKNTALDDPSRRFYRVILSGARNPPMLRSARHLFPQGGRTPLL